MDERYAAPAPRAARRLTRRACILAAVALAACRQSRGGASTKDDCAARAAQLGEFLRQLHEDSPAWSVSSAKLPIEKMKLVSMSAAVAPSRDIDVHVTRARVALYRGDERHLWVDGTVDVASSTDAVLPAVQRILRPVSAADAPARGARLFVEPGVPWDVISVTTRALQEAGVTTATFVFSRTTRMQAPPSARMKAMIDRGDDFATRTRRTYGDCPAALALIRKDPRSLTTKELMDMEDPSPDPEAVLVKIVSELPAAVRSCGCSLDLDGVRAMLYERYHSSWVATGVSVTLAGGDEAAQRIELDRATPWSTAYRSVVTAAGRGGATALLVKGPPPPPPPGSR